MNLQEETKKAFEEEKKRIECESEFEIVDEIFHITDMVQQQRHISNFFYSAITRRIIDFYSSWGNFCHRLLMPNPNSMPDITESQVLDEEDKKTLNKLLKKMMELSSRNSLIQTNIENKTKEEKQFLDDAVNFWEDEAKIALGNILKKINSNWKKEDEETDSKKNEHRYGGVS